MKYQEKASLFGQMEINMTEISKIIQDKDKVTLYLQMVINIMEIG